jgi:hypothetical protein
MRISLDGNVYCITDNDFVDLMESEATFVAKESPTGKFIEILLTYIPYTDEKYIKHSSVVIEKKV